MLVTNLRSPDTAVSAGSVANTWVLPEQKVVFVSIGKNACTSIKWLLAEISGQDLDRFLRQPSDEPTRRNQIHTRKLWTNTPRFTELDQRQLAEISPANGWFVFAVIRDPRLRLFSAWQSKFLVGDPQYYHQRWAGRAWLPRSPDSVDDVLEDWRRFVEVLVDGPGGSAPVGDGHFAPQTDRLQESLVPYSRVYDIRELGELVTDLEDHLHRTVGSAPTLSLGRENETPLPAGREVFEAGVREAIEQHYATDFERFGQLWSFEKIDATSVTWCPAVFTDIAARRAVHERYVDVRQMLRLANRRSTQLGRELTDARKQLDAKDRRIAELEKQVGRPSWRRVLRGGARVAARINRVGTTRKAAVSADAD